MTILFFGQADPSVFHYHIDLRVYFTKFIFHIFIEDGTGDNAIIISPGAAAEVVPADLDDEPELISEAAVFVTQLEQPLDAAVRGLEIARANGVVTILNPAPARPSRTECSELCDYLTPNETGIAAIAGMPVDGVESARAAADKLLARGVGTVVVTLGEKGRCCTVAGGRWWCRRWRLARWWRRRARGTPSTAGSRPRLPATRTNVAVRYGCATAGLSVTRAGAAQVDAESGGGGGAAGSPLRRNASFALGAAHNLYFRGEMPG